MSVRQVKTLGDLMGDAKTAEIKNLLDGKVVRKLMVEGQFVIVDALTEAVTVPLDTELVYETWFMDRGSLLFKLPIGGTVKLCTELDVLTLDNTMEEFSIAPAEDARRIESGQSL